MAELLVIRYGKTPGFEPGDVIVVKPDNWTWTDREQFGENFVVVKRPDLSVSQAEAIYLVDGVPDKVRAAEKAEWRRAFDEQQVALRAAKATIAATKTATAAAAAKGFDDGTLLVDPLTPQEKATLDPATQKVIAVERIIAKVEQSVVEAVLANVMPPDPAKAVPQGVYPLRLRRLDLDALAALGDKATPLDVDLATVTKQVI